MDNCYYEKIGDETKNITEEIPFEIPDSWCWMRIRSFAKVRNGFTPRRDNPEFWTNGVIPWFTIEDKKRQGIVILSTEQHITDIATSKERIVPRDSVLLCCTASVGEVAYTKIDLTTNQQFNGISIYNEFARVVSSLYILNFAFTLKDKLKNDLATATTFGFVSVSKVESILVPIPPFNEQSRIVNALEVIFSKINNINSEKEELVELIDKIKTRILDYYFGENSCYKSYYQSLKLSDICNLEKGVQINIGKLPYLEAKVIRGIKEAKVIEGGTFIKKGTKIILVDGENSGEVMTAPYDGYMGSTFRILQFNQNVVDENFILYFLMLNKEILKNNKTGSAIPHLNKKIFNELIIYLPPLDIQVSDCKKISKILSIIHTIAS